MLTGLIGQRQLLRGQSATRHDSGNLARRNSVSREAIKAEVPFTLCMSHKAPTLQSFLVKKH